MKNWSKNLKNTCSQRFIYLFLFFYLTGGSAHQFFMSMTMVELEIAPQGTCHSVNLGFQFHSLNPLCFWIDKEYRTIIKKNWNIKKIQLYPLNESPSEFMFLWIPSGAQLMTRICFKKARRQGVHRQKYKWLIQTTIIKHLTCVLQHKTIAAERGITTESQEERVGATFNPVRNICAVETTEQGTERVWSIIDVQEIITWF